MYTTYYLSGYNPLPPHPPFPPPPPPHTHIYNLKPIRKLYTQVLSPGFYGAISDNQFPNPSPTLIVLII